MDAPAERPKTAWQPLTPGGVAAFAHAWLGRLLFVQFLVALFAAGCVAWFIQANWFPVVRQAVEHLPLEGEIRSGMLDWRGQPIEKLAENRFLSITVDLEHAGTARSPAHVQIEFGRTNCKVFSLLGYWQIGYPRLFIIAFNRAELQPWWGAWNPAILAIAAGGLIVWLMAAWAFLASLYCAGAWTMGYYLNRDLSLGGSWRLAGAALMPGALFLSLSIVLYGLGFFDLLKLGVAIAVHFVIGWVLVFVAPYKVPYLPGIVPLRQNPFTPAAPPPPEEPPES